MKKKILHVNAGNLFGGVETFLVTTAACRSLCAEMVPEYATFFSGRYHSELLSHGVKAYQLDEVRISRPWSVYRGRRALRKLILNENYDAVLFHQPWIQGLFSSTTNKGTCRVAYFHGPSGNGWPDKLAWCQKPKLVVAPSQDTLETVSDRFPHAIKEVLNYPIPSHILQSPKLDEKERTMFRTSLDANPNDVVILQASRIEMWKGPDVVLKSLASIKHIPNWKFWLAGAPQRPFEKLLFQKLHDIAIENGIMDRVRFLGQRNDISKVMQAADVYTQGNRSGEGFSLSFLEASFFGLPIVTSNLGGAGEMIDSSNGILVPANDESALAQALAKVVSENDLRKRMSSCAKKKAMVLSETKQQLNRLSLFLDEAISAP